jgi:hypothetical protein
MLVKTKSPAKKKTAPGSKPQMLKIEGDWRDAVRLAMQKRKPAEGWPRQNEAAGD